MNNIVNIEIRGEQAQSTDETGSLKLAQELPKQDELTVADVASIIDNMHGVTDPCNNARGVDSYLPEPTTGQTLPDHQSQYLKNKYSTTSAKEKLAGEFGASCLATMGERITLDVYAFWSNEHIADNYKLICPVGRINNQRRVQKRMRLKIIVTNASYVDFGYYVLVKSVLQPSFKELFWIGGNVVDRYGKAKKISPPGWDGGTRFYFGEPVSGAIFAEFDTIYDIWKCTLQGVWTTGKRDYNATVTGIWDGSPPELILVVPDAEEEESVPCSAVDNTAKYVEVTVSGGDQQITPPKEEEKECEQQIDHEIRQICGGGLIDSYTEYVAAKCEDGKAPPGKLVVSYSRSSVDGEVITSEEFEENCCYPPPEPECVPQCLEYMSVNRGGLLPVGGVKGLKKKYGDDVVVAFIWPENGYCGEHVDRLDVAKKECSCPSDSYFDFHVIADFAEIHYGGELVWASGLYTGCTGGDLFFDLPAGSKGSWTVMAYNTPYYGGGESYGAKIAFDFVVGGELVSSIDEGYCDTADPQLLPGGLFYTGSFKCQR